MDTNNEPAPAPEGEAAPEELPASGSAESAPKSIFGEIEAVASEAVAAVEHEVGAAVASVETTIEEKRQDLESWFEKHIRDSVVSRSTDSYNRVFAALETIRAELARHTGD